MPPECYPISVLPHLSRLFLDYCEHSEALSPFYSASPNARGWMASASPISPQARVTLADLLESQSRRYRAEAAAFENIQKLRNGASAMVTGQQVALFGGPLYTLLKAATAIQHAQEATAAGHPCVPIFWMATEDHDFAEVDSVKLPDHHALHTVSLQTEHAAGLPVGGIRLGDGIEQALKDAKEILGAGPILEQLRCCYTPEATFAEAFGQLIAAVFAPWGLIVMDAAGREFHRLGSHVLRQAITETGALRKALSERDTLLMDRGYHAQVLVGEQSSLLFLLDETTGARLPLRRPEKHEKHSENGWKAGSRSYSTDELLKILETAPERLSPSALLRPVFQDAILPTAAYIGGPAEIAYFAQTEVLYRSILGRVTPVLPRLSATLIEPAIATVMARHELSLPDVFLPAGELAQRLGARSMPVEGKRKLAAAGEALGNELEALTGWMGSLDEGLGRAAATSASKMRYQMNRLRRLAANYQLQREASLTRHADAVRQSLYPDGHLQERVVGSAYFLARGGDELPARLVEAAQTPCPGHKVIPL